MKLATIRTANGTKAARIEGDEAVELDASDVGAILGGALGGLAGAASADGPRAAVADLDLAPVIPRPGKVLCVGQNYLSHIQEMGAKVPEFPTLFTKFPSTLIGARDDIYLPPESTTVDWEVELVVVVGKTVRRVDRAGALDAIAGYTVMNDISMRDWQNRTRQWMQGKAWEHSTPVGPWLVTPDETDHAADLRVTCEVDGEVMQDGRTSDLIFDGAHVLSYMSTVLTLEPGDIIATGTTGGVGHGRDPQVYLRAGQTVRTTIEGIGELVNLTVAEPAVSAS